MKLYLDDVRLAPEGWYLARTAAAAIMHLAGGTVEELSLDHDLDVCALCEEELAPGGIVLPCTVHDRGNGLQVVDWMIEKGVWPEGRARVHSEMTAYLGRDVAARARFEERLAHFRRILGGGA